MKRFLVMFLVIGVLGIYGQTTEVDIKQQADTIKINEQDVHSDTSNITENTSDTLASKETDNLPLIEAKKNPWLYDWRYGCLMDGLTYLIPMITLYSIAERVDDKFLPLDNYCTPCIYPIGLVFIEKMLRNILTTKDVQKDVKISDFSMSIQTGEALPYYEYPYYNEIGLPYADFLHLTSISLKYDIEILKNIKVNLVSNYYQFLYFSGPSFISTGIGMKLNNFDIYFEKVILGCYSIGDISFGLEQYFEINEYLVLKTEDHYIVNFKYDFWGIGIGWGKKYKIWKELYIEPMLSYKFMYTFDFRSGCITGIFGGLGIGYKF